MLEVKQDVRLLNKEQDAVFKERGGTPVFGIPNGVAWALFHKGRTTYLMSPIDWLVARNTLENGEVHEYMVYDDDGVIRPLAEIHPTGR